MTDSATLFFLGFVLIFVGVAVLIAAAVLVGVLRSKNGKVKAAGVVIIGPVPIVFGPDKKSVKTILAMSVALTTLIIVLFLIYCLTR